MIPDRRNGTCHDYTLVKSIERERGDRMTEPGRGMHDARKSPLAAAKPITI